MINCFLSNILKSFFAPRVSHTQEIKMDQTLHTDIHTTEHESIFNLVVAVAGAVLSLLHPFSSARFVFFFYLAAWGHFRYQPEWASMIHATQLRMSALAFCFCATNFGKVNTTLEFFFGQILCHIVLFFAIYISRHFNHSFDLIIYRHDAKR